MKKKYNEPWEKVFKDRFLKVEKPDNIFVTVALYFFVFFMSFILIFVSFVQLCGVLQSSMENTLHSGDKVLVLRGSENFTHEDIVIITIEEKGSKPFNIIKRVVGIGGDTLKFQENPENKNYVTLFRKNKGSDTFTRVSEPYIKETMLSSKFQGDYAPNKEIVIPEDTVFALGDNRNNSEDSRSYGAFPVQSIVGKMFLKIDRGSPLEWFLLLIYGEPSDN